VSPREHRRLGHDCAVNFDADCNGRTAYDALGISGDRREESRRRAATRYSPRGGNLQICKSANLQIFTASLAEIHYIALAPHSAAGPVGVAASIQAMAAIPNFLIHEFGGGTGEELFKVPLSYRNGYVELPTGPGLGIELDEERIEANTHTEYRSRTLWRHEDDGSVADI